MMPVKRISAVLIITLITSFTVFGQKAGRSLYQLKIYHLENQQQEARVDQFLEKAFLPALHKYGIQNVGVFKPRERDSIARTYVLIPYKSFDQLEKLEKNLASDKLYLSAGKDYIDALYNNVPYSRIETILLSAFEGMPSPNKPSLSGPKADRVYELRSYEGGTEKYYVNKVKMFNKGDEIGLFNRLGFNAIFYAEVISGSKMPNLMYMTSFEDKADREAHWKSFGNDPEWKKLSADPQYSNNVSHIDITFLYPTEYSDY